MHELNTSMQTFVNINFGDVLSKADPNILILVCLVSVHAVEKEISILTNYMRLNLQ